MESHLTINMRDNTGEPVFSAIGDAREETLPNSELILVHEQFKQDVIEATYFDTDSLPVIKVSSCVILAYKNVHYDQI